MKLIFVLVLVLVIFKSVTLRELEKTRNGIRLKW